MNESPKIALSPQFKGVFYEGVSEFLKFIESVIEFYVLGHVPVFVLWPPWLKTP